MSAALSSRNLLAADAVLRPWNRGGPIAAPGIEYPGPMDKKETYSEATAYGRSKLANILFARVTFAA